MSRRLGIETMEGRTMWSATTIELVPPDFHSAHLTFAIGRLDTAGNQTISLTMPSEGGFITNLDTSVLHFNGVFGQTSVDANLSLNDLITRDQFSMNGTSDSVQLVGSAYDGDGLQPAVITFSDNGGQQPASQGVIVGPLINQSGQDEGGSIPIHSLLAGLRNDQGLAAAERSFALSPVGKPAGSRYVARLATSSESALSGELGRGIVFEIAGGEPGVSTRQTPEVDATLQGDEPLSAIGGKRDEAELTGREHGAAQVVDQTGDIVARERSANEPTLRTAAIADHIDFTDVIASSSPSLPTTAGQGGAVMSAYNSDSELQALASAAAFEQFGEGKMAFVESSTIGNWWERSLAAMPLLVVLAMERIAAHNARRPTSEAPAKVAGKPL
jgi:hypothetical protein